MLNFESAIRPALKTEHPHMTQQEIEVFRRKWEVSGNSPTLLWGITNVCEVLFHVLRGWVCDKDAWRCYYHCWKGRRFGVDGRYPCLIELGGDI